MIAKNCFYTCSYQRVVEDINERFGRNKLMKVSFKKGIEGVELLIKVKYKNRTGLNPFILDILFSIEIDQLFPESLPNIVCNTNFIQPTLFDCRNLLFSLTKQQWSNKTNLVDIIERIPEFLHRVKDDIKFKTLVYYGDFKLLKSYNVNDFMSNLGEIGFYRVNQVIHCKKSNSSRKKIAVIKKRYLILTEVNYLLLEPDNEQKFIARLILVGDVHDLDPVSELCGNEDINQAKNSLKIKLKHLTINDKENEPVELILEFEQGKREEFIKRSDLKIKMLKKTYKISQDDMSKPSVVFTDNAYQLGHLNYITENNIAKLLEITKYKEELFKEYKTDNLIQEMILIYQKLIEIYSSCNNSDFEIYLEKLKNLLHSSHQNRGLRSEPESSSSNSSSTEIKTLFSECNRFGKEDGNKVDIGNIENIENVEEYVKVHHYSKATESKDKETSTIAYDSMNQIADELIKELDETETLRSMSSSNSLSFEKTKLKLSADSLEEKGDNKLDK